MASYRIAIIGAGPAGCMLARLLQQSDQSNAFKITIFESEASINFRSQGGSLDLHDDTGLKAVKKAGLWEEFLKHARYDGEALKIADKNLLCYIKMSASEKSSFSGRPEIDRPRLREMLYDSLPTNIVEWNKKLLSVGKDRILHFADGTTRSDFDLVIGADGAWSKVRPTLSSVQPFYSGIGGHSITIPNAKTEVPHLYKLINRGSVFSVSDEKSIMSQYMGNGSLNTGTWSVRPADWQTTSGYDVHDPVATAEHYRTVDFADWHPDLVALTQQPASVGPVIPRDLYMLPVGHSWDHVPGLTLMGDAAHLMTPFAGEGVNLAFADALALAEELIAAATETSNSRDQISSVNVLDKHVDAFEKDMFKRATVVQQMTVDMMTALFFTPGSPRTSIEKWVSTAVAGNMPVWIAWIVTPLVYTWFFVFKLFY